MKDLFEDAATHVERGWCQGVSAKMGEVPVAFDHDRASHFCAGGAIGRAAKFLHGNAWREAYSEALAHVNKHIRASDPKLHLMSWNDAAGRSQEQVVHLLRVCAAEVA